MKKNAIRITMVILINLLMSGAVYAEDYCTGVSCETGVVAAYQCTNGYPGEQVCGYVPVTKHVCSEQGCYTAPVQSVAECNDMNIGACAVRPAGRLGLDGANGHARNYDNQNSHRDFELYYSCSVPGSAVELKLSLTKKTIQIEQAGKVKLIENLVVEQLSPTFQPELKEFTTRFKNQNGEVIFAIEDYNLDTLNGFGFGVLKNFKKASCRVH